MASHEPIANPLFLSMARYLTVQRDGIVISPGERPRASVDVRILRHGSARTLYASRQPICRSLDGAHPLTDAKKLCSRCEQRELCTKQTRLDLFLDGLPYRLLLAFSSDRNFRCYVFELDKLRLRVEDGMHRIDVVPRPRWGELRFSRIPDSIPGC